MSAHDSAELDGMAATIPRGKLAPPLRQLGLAGAALLAAAAAAWYGHDWWTVGRFIESTDDAYVGGDVTVIAPKVAGFIAEVAVTDNQAVHAGDLLVKLDDRDYRRRAGEGGRGRRRAAGDARPISTASRRLQEAMIAAGRRPSSPPRRPRSRAASTMSIAIAASRRTSVASVQRFQQADADYRKALGRRCTRRAPRWTPRSASST